VVDWTAEAEPKLVTVSDALKLDPTGALEGGLDRALSWRSGRAVVGVGVDVLVDVAVVVAEDVLVDVGVAVEVRVEVGVGGWWVKTCTRLLSASLT
jgi:hypothetical protein